MFVASLRMDALVRLFDANSAQFYVRVEHFNGFFFGVVGLHATAVFDVRYCGRWMGMLNAINLNTHF